MADLRVVLLGMTGFGNGALHGLLACAGVHVAAVVTPPEDTPSGFPYYDCEALGEMAAARGIPLIEEGDFKTPRLRDALRSLAPELIIVGSFPSILPKGVIVLPRLGVINFHPSLLPRYRGATPTFWVLFNGEAETGVTAHWIEDERLDTGRIILQKHLAIRAEWNDGELRRELATLISDTVPEVVALALSRERGAFPVQDEQLATTFPKRSTHRVPIQLKEPSDDLVRVVRSANPFPGVTLRVGDQDFRVLRAHVTPFGERPLRSAAVAGELRVRLRDGELRLELAELPES